MQTLQRRVAVLVGVAVRRLSLVARALLEQQGLGTQEVVAGRGAGPVLKVPEPGPRPAVPATAALVGAHEAVTIDDERRQNSDSSGALWCKGEWGN